MGSRKAPRGPHPELRDQIETGEPGEELLADLAATETELHSLQGEQPLVHPVVDGQAVAEVVET